MTPFISQSAQEQERPLPAPDFLYRSAELVPRALKPASTLLRPGGSLRVKVFQGAQLSELRRAFTEAFDKVTLEKPKASRAESVEIFLLGIGRKG